MGDLSPYKVGAHQHVPEIKQATGARQRCRSRPSSRRCRAASWPPSPRRPARRHADADVRAVLQARTPTSRSCTCCPRARGRTRRRPLGSNACHLQATVDVDSGRIIVRQRARQPRQGRRRPGRAVRQPHARPARDRRPAGRVAPGVQRPMSVDQRPQGLPGRRRRRRAQGRRRRSTSRSSSTTARLRRAAGVFTANRVKAAPVLWSQQVLQGRRSCARSCSTPAAPTPAPARRASRTPTPPPSTSPPCCAGVEPMLVGAGDVAVCSTGLIGERLPMDKLLAGVDAAVAALWPRTAGRPPPRRS